MRPLLLASISLALPLSSAHAQVQDGDLIVNLFAATTSSLEHYRADGTHVSSTPVAGEYAEGAVVTASGRLATTTREPNRLRLFEGGVEVGGFALPEVGFVPGDVDRFSDGTLVVVDQGGEVELYTEGGAHLASWSAPQMTHPFGCHVDANDHLWVTDVVTPVSPPGYLLEFGRDGTLLHAIGIPIQPGDVSVADDGTLWVSDHDQPYVHHVSPAGALLGSLPTPTVGPIDALALAGDGALWTAGRFDDHLTRLDAQGAVLGQVPLPGNGDPLFVHRARVGSLGASYCAGDGTATPCPCGNAGGAGEGCASSAGHGATLMASGSDRVALDALVLRGAGLIAGQPALLFAGTTAVNGGAGVAFGDGLRCAGGAVARLGVQTPAASGEATWGPGLNALGGWQAGDVRRFQAWYRDPVGGPCGAGFNLTNGVELAFQP